MSLEFLYSSFRLHQEEIFIVLITEKNHIATLFQPNSQTRLPSVVTGNRSFLNLAHLLLEK